MRKREAENAIINSGPCSFSCPILDSSLLVSANRSDIIIRFKNIGPGQTKKNGLLIQSGLISIFLFVVARGLGSVEMVYGTPFLLQLGLSKSLMSLVWLAGPLSGMCKQEFIII